MRCARPSSGNVPDLWLSPMADRKVILTIAPTGGMADKTVTRKGAPGPCTEPPCLRAGCPAGYGQVICEYTHNAMRSAPVPSSGSPQ